MFVMAAMRVPPQTFVKAVNYQHMMPTRYTLDVDLKVRTAGGQ